jgi:predicted rRNA methylase YqxC with S4 and FtsJ domains
MMMERIRSPFGLSFNQIIAIVAISGGLITAYTELNTRIAKLEVDNTQMEYKFSKAESERETARQENRADHLRLEQKIDLIITNLSFVSKKNIN